MTSKQLPEHPSLDQLKKQAKSLLRAAQAKDSTALGRFKILPAFAAHPLPHAAGLALHDAQSVIAREHGFVSWNALREQVEERTLGFGAAVAEFVRSATGGAPDRARRLLALHAGIATATMETALVLGDLDTIGRRLAANPTLAVNPTGAQSWEPILYICHTCLHHGEPPARADALVAIARRLLALGANPNATYHWNWHPELPRTALWGALFGTRHIPLAELLLEAGANPTDGVSSHIAAGGGHLPALELLARYGLKVDGLPGGVPPLAHLMGWADVPAGARWLLEHGADANLAWGDAGEAPVHLAARRWDVAMLELLAAHGADLQRRRADGCTAHTIAALQGNQAVAAWLLAHGVADELSPLECFVAACARGDRPAARAMLQGRPGLRTELKPEHHLMLHRPAESGDARVLETMLACGFDPRAPDRERVMPLHRAAMGGHVDAVRVLLAFNAPVEALDGMFSGTPLLWAAEGWSSSGSAIPATGAPVDHVAVARLLLAAGSPPEWNPPPGAPGPERVLDALVALRSAAAQSTPA